MSGGKYTKRTTFDVSDSTFATEISWHTQDGEEIFFDLNSRSIKIAYHYSNDLAIDANVSCPSPRFNRTPVLVYDGHLYEKMLFECNRCGNYRYMVQIIIDMGKKQIDDILLNYEQLTWTDGDMIYQFRNIYTYDMAEYTTCRSGAYGLDKVKNYKMTNLPLIPLNLDEPEKTIERIKTLVLFS